MDRQCLELKRGRGKVKDIKRHTWCSYENFENMYRCAYSQMVEAGVAIELPEEKYFDRLGNIVEDHALAYGRKSKYQITKP